MFQDQNKIKTPHKILTSQPPNLTLQAQFDKIMSSIIIHESLVNPEALGQFVKKNKLQKLSEKDINKLFHQFNNRQRKRFLVNKQIYQNQSKIKHSQSEKQIKTLKKLGHINVSRSNIKRHKGQLTFSTTIQNQDKEQRQIIKKHNNIGKKIYSSQNQYFGKDVLKFKQKKINLSKSSKAKSQINGSKKFKTSSSLSKFVQSKKKSQQSQCKRQEKSALQDWLKKMIDMEQLHKKQIQSHKQLNTKEMKRLRKIHSIEEQRLKQQIIQVAQNFLNT